jgi:hypothetical protein
MKLTYETVTLITHNSGPRAGMSTMTYHSGHTLLTVRPAVKNRQLLSIYPRTIPHQRLLPPPLQISVSQRLSQKVLKKVLKKVRRNFPQNILPTTLILRLVAVNTAVRTAVGADVVVVAVQTAVRRPIAAATGKKNC